MARRTRRHFPPRGYYYFFFLADPEGLECFVIATAAAAAPIPRGLTRRSWSLTLRKRTGFVYLL